ncbi:MAG: ABC transporter permease [Clostridiales bacterium]|nr:ABC transporter permease [Clostridiales bacterium]
MRHILTILKWEISKIMSSWQKTLAIFLIPAAVLVGAITLFPKLLNYLSTGSTGNQKVVVVNAPDSFMQFDGRKDDLYNYVYMTDGEFDSEYGRNGQDTPAYDYVRDGKIIVTFGTMSDKPFDESVRNRYKTLIETGEDVYSGDAFLDVLYNAEQFTTQLKGEQFIADILSPYQAYLADTVMSEFGGYQSDAISVDDFNPITKILDNRAVANNQASRVIPGIMMILIYYCVYSLALDMIAMEKNRGFLNKLIMTPVSPYKLLAGKALAINILVTGSSLLTFFLLFVSSWLNRSNDAGSLLPFGLFLMPDQLIYMILSIPFCVFVLTGFCFLVAISLDKFEDVTANLQLVLLLLLIGFFIGMFVYWSPIGLEYVIPVHNTIALMKDILMSEVTPLGAFVVMTENFTVGFFLMRRCASKLNGGLR